MSVRDEYCTESIHRMPVDLAVVSVDTNRRVTFKITAWGDLTAPWGWVGHGKAPNLSQPPSRPQVSAGIREDWTIVKKVGERVTEFTPGQLVLAEYRDGFGVDGGIVF